MPSGSDGPWAAGGLLPKARRLLGDKVRRWSAHGPLRPASAPWTAGKNNHVSGPFFISFSVVVRKSNPWRPLRHDANRMTTSLIPQKNESPSEGPKNGVQGQRTPYASAGDDDGHGRINFPDGRFRRKSVCTCVCTFDFDGPKRLQCLRAVRLRPVLDSSRMRFYAPYAVPLKGKRPKKVQLPKEVHKVHTALCMRSQPYSRLVFCSSRKSA